MEAYYVHCLGLNLKLLHVLGKQRDCRLQGPFVNVGCYTPPLA